MWTPLRISVPWLRSRGSGKARSATTIIRCIVFTRTKHDADRLAKKLAGQGVPSGALHGGMTQSARTKTLDRFKTGHLQTLVATNVAARGIHVDGISLVVHFDAPTDPKDYLQRAGRTARAGESGTVVTMTAPRQQRTVRSMTDRCGVKPTVTRVKPMSSELVTITGAQVPCGVPWQAAPTKSVKPHHHGAGSSRGHRPRSRRPHKGRAKATTSGR